MSNLSHQQIDAFVYLGDLLLYCDWRIVPPNHFYNVVVRAAAVELATPDDRICIDAELDAAVSMGERP